MLAEGILALVALTTVAILTPEAVKGLAPASIFIKGGSLLLGNVGLPAAVGSAYLSVVIIVLAITIMHIALRISRLAMAELAGPKLGGLFRNVYLTSIIVSAVVYVVTSPRFGAAFSYIWATFGGANQLMAGMALMIATLWLTKNKRPTTYTIVPMLFMLVTTISALIYLAYTGITLYAADPTKIGAGIAAFINVLLLVLAFFMCYEGAGAFKKIRAAAK